MANTKHAMCQRITRFVDAQRFQEPTSSIVTISVDVKHTTTDGTDFFDIDKAAHRVYQ